MLLSLILGTTAIGALGTVLLTGTKEKKNNELQKPTVNHNHYNISGNTVDHSIRIDKSISGNSNCNINTKEDNDKEIINAIRELFREQEQLSQDDQTLLNDIMANNQELARLIRK